MSKRTLITLVLILIACVAFIGWSLYADYNDPTSATAPNGEPIGAQHPRSERP